MLACSQAQDPDGCLALLDRMRGKGQEPGAINYARTASALARAGRVEEARVLLRAAAKRGGKGPLIQVDRAAYGALILACGERGDAAAAEAIMGVVEEMSKLGVAPDALTVAQAVSALARGCGRLAEAEALLRGSSSSSSGGGGKGRGAASLLAYHALMLAAVERKGGQGQQGAGAARRCEELLASMVETHGLCPTPVTRALVYQAGCGAKALAAVDACVLPSAGEGDEGREEEEEGKGEGAAVVSLEAARRSVERALALNPHDERRRTLHRALGAL